MGDRRFTDKAGKLWQIRVEARREWTFEPVDDNPGPRRTATPPGYESDPFEMSIEELQQLLDDAPVAKARPKSSPFLD